MASIFKVPIRSLFRLSSVPNSPVSMTSRKLFLFDPIGISSIKNYYKEKKENHSFIENEFKFSLLVPSHQFSRWCSVLVYGFTRE